MINKQNSDVGVCTHQDLLGGLRPDHAAEVAEVGGAHLADLEEGVGTEAREPLQEQPLGHLPPDQRRHLGHELRCITGIMRLWVR